MLKNIKVTYSIVIGTLLLFSIQGKIYKEPRMKKSLINNDNEISHLIKKRILFPYAITREKVIALTFDDGPNTKFRLMILDILKIENVKATFFDLGWKIEKSPILVQRTVAEGHEVANHSYSHRTLTKLSFIKKKLELRLTNEAISNITKKRTHLFRPPGGIYNQETTTVAKNLGLITVLWTCDPGDYESDNPVLSPSAEFIVQKVKYNIFPGGIILLHDGIDKTIEVLPEIISHLKKLNYKFLTVSELIALDARNRR